MRKGGKINLNNIDLCVPDYFLKAYAFLFIYFPPLKFNFNVTHELRQKILELYIFFKFGNLEISISPNTLRGFKKAGGRIHLIISEQYQPKIQIRISKERVEICKKQFFSFAHFLK